MRFRVRPGKNDRVNEWMDFLNQNMEAVRQTLEPEQMYVETIFSETLDGVDYLYWYSVQGEQGQDVSESEHWLDEKHLAFWDECIDETFTPQVLTPRVMMLPERVQASMRPLED